MTSSSIKERSLTDDGRRQTRENLERELDHVAAVARELDDERDDEPDSVVDGHTVFGLLHRPVRRYLALRTQKHSPSGAAKHIAGHPLHERPGQAKVTTARVRFSALTQTLACLDHEDGADEVFVEWSNVIERTHQMKLALDRWARDAKYINDAIERVVQKSEGKYVTLLPELPHALSYFDVAKQIRQLEVDFGDVAALICPDVLNFSRGVGSKRTNYSLGRLLAALSKGWIMNEQGMTLRPAYSFIERMNLVVDDTAVTADDGKEDRYAAAESRFTEWFTRDPSKPPAAEE